MLFVLSFVLLIAFIIFGTRKAKKGQIADTLTNAVAPGNVEEFIIEPETVSPTSYNLMVKEFNKLLLRYQISKSPVVRNALAPRLLKKQIDILKAKAKLPANTKFANQ